MGSSKEEITQKDLFMVLPPRAIIESPLIASMISKTSKKS
jgi:hypothetical protein